MDNENYHADAVRYNETMALAAEELANSLDDRIVKKWCAGIGKQHRFHLKRHRSALAKIRGQKDQLSSEESPVHVIDEFKLRNLSLDSGPNAFGEVIHAVEKTVAEEQAEFAAQQETVEDDIVLEGKD